MNIVFISKYVVLPEHGSPTRQYFIAKYLSELSNKVLLIGSRSTLAIIPKFKGYYISKKKENFETITLNGPAINLGFNLKRIYSWILFEFNIFRFRRKIKLFKPDVIIVSSLSIFTFLSGVFLKRWLKVPLIVEIRDIYPLTLQEVGNFASNNPVIAFLKWIEKVGYKNADLIVSSLPNAKEHISSVLKGTPFEFVWIPMGIDPGFYNIKDNIERSSVLQRQFGDFIVMYAGSIGKANALDVIFNAAKKLKKSHPQIKFVLIGDGPLKSFYKEEYGHLTNIEFMDPINKKELPNVLKHADILINTWLDKPIYRFGISPNKWMDYMYAAKPILVAFSGYRCIIEEAKCGWFIPAEDEGALISTIIHLSQIEPDELKKIGNNGQSYLLKHLTYEKLASDFNKRLRSLIGR